jgi:hypothetical protein
MSNHAYPREPLSASDDTTSESFRLLRRVIEIPDVLSLSED